MSVRSAIVGQFRRPHGLLGRLAGSVMANRPSNRARNAWTVRLLDLAPTDRVLEIGCGPGLGLAAALAEGRQGRALGLDHSPLMVARAARANRAALEEGRLSLLCAGLPALAQLAGPFDKAFAVNVLQFVPAPARRDALARLRAILADGGRVAVTFQPRLPRATAKTAHDFAAALSGELAAAGFGGIRTEQLDLEPVPAVCVLATAPR